MRLDGIRVIDLARLLPGAYCTQLLAQQGADVLMIEPPGGEPLPGLPAGSTVLEPFYRGKQRITLDLRSDPGRDAFFEQLARADVLVEGFRPGVMERLDLGYAALRLRRPELVYCAITGYGSTGPLSQRAGHDLNYLARSGALSLMPLADGLPVIPGLQMADLAGGLMAAYLVAAALAKREKTGSGQRVEVSMSDVIQGWTAVGGAARRAGLPSVGLSGELPCYRVYRVTDGFITIGALEPRFWLNLCNTLQRPDLVSRQFDPSATAELAEIFQRRSRREWVARFQGVDACLEPVLSLAESEDVASTPGTALAEEPLPDQP